MASRLHSDLCQRGARWMRKNGFGVVATELSAGHCREQPDVIGFRSTCSLLLEVKVSRSDFLADGKKPERSGRRRGVGLYRAYLCPEGLIGIDELPPGWGLLYADARGIRKMHMPPGNIWPGTGGSANASWAPFQHEVDERAERGILYSIARRSQTASA